MLSNLAFSVCSWALVTATLSAVLSLNNPSARDAKTAAAAAPAAMPMAPADDLAAANQLLLPREGDPGQGVVAQAHRALFRAVVAPADGRPQEPAASARPSKSAKERPSSFP